jgi:hypothetical protein
VATGPRVAGGPAGSAGAVGEAVGPAPEMDVSGGVVDAAPGSASPVHAASANARHTDAIAPENAPENAVENAPENAPESAPENAVENLC